MTIESNTSVPTARIEPTLHSRMNGGSRRSRVLGMCLICALLIGVPGGAGGLGGCEEKSPQGARGSETGKEPSPQPAPQSLIVYTSADDEVIKAVVDMFEKDTGIKVEWSGDTEQTKTTGLVQRVIAEKEAPRADVWWSSEPFGTIRLAREGLLEAYRSKTAESSIPGGWPSQYRATDGTWYGFSPRARVIVYNTLKVRKEEMPRTIHDLAHPRFKGRVGIARPQFGTTGGHLAVLAHVYGEPALEAWMKAMVENRVKQFDGNMSVVRAVGTGELLVGLTDTDDVWAGQRNKWPVDLIYDPNDIAASPMASFKGWGKIESLALGAGPLLLPNTVAVVKGAKNQEHARKFVDFMLSEKVENLLLNSGSHNLPLRERHIRDSRNAMYTIPVRTMQPMAVDLERAADQMEPALRLFEAATQEK